MITIVEGGIYLDGRGIKVGPMIPSTASERDPFYQWMSETGGSHWHYSANGRSYQGFEHSRDIISVVQEPEPEKIEVWTGEWLDAE